MDRSFGFEPRGLDDSPEALVVAQHARAELLRRLLQRLEAAVGEPLLHGGIVLHGVDLAHQRGDDALRRASGRDDPEPGVDIECRSPASAAVGMSGAALSRSCCETASTRTVPAAMWLRTTPRPTKISCTCPARRSVSAGPAPR